MTTQMTVQSGIRSRGMRTLMQRVRGEGLSIDELLALRDDDMVVGRGVVGRGRSSILKFNNPSDFELFGPVAESVV